MSCILDVGVEFGQRAISKKIRCMTFDAKIALIDADGMINSLREACVHRYWVGIIELICGTRYPGTDLDILKVI